MREACGLSCPCRESKKNPADAPAGEIQDDEKDPDNHPGFPVAPGRVYHLRRTDDGRAEGHRKFPQDAADQTG